MRKIFLSVFFVAGFAAAFGQCIPDTTNSQLIYPPSEGLPCVERGVPYNATIQFFCLPSIGGFPVDSILITSFLDLPAGITYSFTPNPCKLYPYTHGCVQISGTTTAPAGSYIVDYNGFAYAQAGTASFDWLKTNFGGVLPEYSLKVIEPAASCPNTPSAISTFSNTPAFSVYPNPTHGVFEIKTESAIRDGQITIADATGRIVYSQPLSSLTSNINLSGFPSGLYLVQLRTADGVREKKITIE